MTLTTLFLQAEEAVVDDVEAGGEGDGGGPGGGVDCVEEDALEGVDRDCGGSGGGDGEDAVGGGDDRLGIIRMETINAALDALHGDEAGAEIDRELHVAAGPVEYTPAALSPLKEYAAVGTREGEIHCRAISIGRTVGTTVTPPVETVVKTEG